MGQQLTFLSLVLILTTGRLEYVTLQVAWGLKEILYEKLLDSAWEIGKLTKCSDSSLSKLLFTKLNVDQRLIPLNTEGRDRAESWALEQHSVNIWRVMS